ncbi:MAG: polymer-forming cytoskeletal protein [Balneolaceae bacterium]|jgi:cytoskeletal protein CcmA (bactofilin family)|nr:MAG: polymer-forming cytoskeletal protein [Balneolaceae bacterium]
MFKNKKEQTTVNDTSQKSPILNMISEGTKIKGSITSENDIRISGKIEGEARCKGKIIIASSAHIQGDLISVDADVSGNVDGTIKVSNRLILRQSANIGGDIHTKLLVVEEGAQINGSFKMGAGNDVLDGLTDTIFAENSKKKTAKEVN